jgi:hypothetical protein
MYIKRDERGRATKKQGTRNKEQGMMNNQWLLDIPCSLFNIPILLLPNKKAP